MPAFNEASGIGSVLRTLIASPEFGPDMEIVVAANGCTDGTAEIARSYGVRVVEIATASKAAALNAGDEVATGDVRIYLDADVPAGAGLLRALAAAVTEPGIVAAVPRPHLDTAGSSWPVRSYYEINARLPVFRGRLFGRGVIALSAAGRARFSRFPDLIADDMFLDAIFAADEKREIDAVVRVLPPRRTGDLVNRVARARAGNEEFWRFLRSGAAGGPAADPVSGSSSVSWLRDVLLRSPRLLPAAACYVLVVLAAESRRRRAGWSARSGWGRNPAAPSQGPALDA